MRLPPLRPQSRTAVAFLAALLLVAPGADATSSAFPDVPKEHWAASFIEELASGGVLKGRSDGKFHPQLLVTRAELAKIALKAAKLPVQEGLPDPYADLPDDHSLRDALLTAFARDMLRPLGDAAAPDRPATRAETLEALMDAFGHAPDLASAPAFPDTQGEVAGYANAAKALGVISGNGGKFLPEHSVTRAETAKMAAKLRRVAKKRDEGDTPPASSTPPSSSPPASSAPPTGTACAEQGGVLPQLFPSDNWWNLRVDSAPLDPNSAGYIGFIGATRRAHPDFGGNANADGSEIYGMPYAVVCGTQPLLPVTYVDYGDESDAGAPGRPGFPIPELAKTQNGWIEGGAPGSVAPQGDRHLLIVDRDHLFLYELYRAHWNGTRWEAGSGAVFDLSGNGRRPEGWTSADAAGLAILPGLVRYDEAHGTGEITHAFRVTVRATNGFVWPASHKAGATSGALPMGARLRLKASKDVSAETPEVQKIFRAMQRYGLIVADNGSDLYVTGAYDTRWNNDVLNPAFSRLTAADFEVVRLGWRP